MDLEAGRRRMWRRSDELMVSDLFLSPSKNVLSVSRHMTDSWFRKVRSQTRQIKASLKLDELDWWGWHLDADESSKHEELIWSELKSDPRPTTVEHVDFSSVLLTLQPCFGNYMTEQADLSVWPKRSTGWCPPAVLDRGDRGPPRSRFSAALKRRRSWSSTVSLLCSSHE